MGSLWKSFWQNLQKKKGARTKISCNGKKMNAKVLFESEAKKFDNVIPLLIPYYSEIYDILLDSIPFYKDSQAKILDIGCGTGTFAKTIKNKFPNAKITCLDFAKNMIDVAKEKLDIYGKDITYLVGDFNELNITDEYDVIVSSFALHHIQSDEEKKRLYNNIYRALKHKGVFFTADVVLGVNNYIKNLYEKKWEEHLIKKSVISKLGTERVEMYKTDDNPSTLYEHLTWLEKSGFNQVETLWKYYNFAVFGGFKFTE